MSVPKKVIFTLDLEDHLARYDQSSRYPSISRRVLEALSRKGISGTVFVVGKIARAEPTLLREIADLGYEIACHSLDHLPLDKQTARRFRENTSLAKTLIEDCVGKPVVGFRAPIFSLTERTIWAVDVLADLGFHYSSSVMPAHNPLYGFPNAPASPFLWPNGLTELPCPVERLGLLTLPYLGGFYLRYLPQHLIRSCVRRAHSQSCLWTYCHPYDFDTAEPFTRIQGAALWTSALLWFNRRNTLRKILDVVPADCKLTMNAWVKANSANLPMYRTVGT